MMKYLRFGLAFAGLFYCLPAIAQNSGAVPQYAVPIGKGAGTTGFDSAAPGTAGQALVSNGAGAKPTFQSVSSASFGAQNANKVFAGPATGADALPDFRALVGADLPLPGPSALGGVQSLTASTSNFLTGLGTDGVFTRAQPAFNNLSGSATCAQLPALTGNVTSSAGSCATTIASGVVSNSMLAGSIAASKLIGTDIATVGTLTAGATGTGVTVNLGTSTITGTLPAASLPNPTSSTLGGVQSAAAVSNQWINSISTSGVPSLSQPAFSNLSGTLGSTQIGTSTITGLTNKATPDSANDYVIIYDNAGTAIKKATVGAVGAAGSVTGGQLPATATNDNASAGNLGEFVSGTLASGSAITLTTGSPANVTSISLTAGDWDVRGNITFIGGGSPSTLTQQVASISTTSATLSTVAGQRADFFIGGNTGINIGSSNSSQLIGPVRLSLSTTTTVYLVARASFSDNAVKAHGIIEARRVR